MENSLLELIDPVPIHSWLLLVVFFTLLSWGLLKIIIYYKNLPPGPWGVPLLGYLPFLSNQPPHKFYVELSKRYGDVFSIQLGSNLVVGIGSAALLRDVFNRPDSTSRPKTPLSLLMDGLGIITSDGLLWKRQRTFLHEKFRALGVTLFPSERFEKIVIMELEELFITLEETNREAVAPHSILGRHVHNIICQLMMSFRFEKDDEEFVMFNERVSRGMMLFGQVHMGEHFKPYLYLPGKQAVLKEIRRNLVDISEFHVKHLKQRTNERAELANKGSAPKDLLDCYLDKLQNQKVKRGKKNQIFPGVEPDKQIIQVMNDLFSAGMDTSLSTLLWCMVIMLREPQAAIRVREELRKIVAPGDLVYMKHRLSTPYLEAVVFETMRLCSIVPLGTTHVNDTTWHIDGHTIPAGTHIIPLIHKINMDPHLYPEPETFKPERFIKDGQCNSSDFIQFGVGQRKCLGNILARVELYVLFANIMNTFEFSLPEGAPVPSLEGVLGVTHAPLPFKISFTKLKQ